MGWDGEGCSIRWDLHVFGYLRMIRGWVAALSKSPGVEHITLFLSRLSMPIYFVLKMLSAYYICCIHIQVHFRFQNTLYHSSKYYELIWVHVCNIGYQKTLSDERADTIFVNCGGEKSGHFYKHCWPISSYYIHPSCILFMMYQFISYACLMICGYDLIYILFAPPQWFITTRSDFLVNYCVWIVINCLPDENLCQKFVPRSSSTEHPACDTSWKNFSKKIM